MPALLPSFGCKVSSRVRSWVLPLNFAAEVSLFVSVTVSFSGSVDYYLYGFNAPTNWFGYIEAKALDTCTPLMLRQNYAELISLLGPALEQPAVPILTPFFAYGCLTNGEVWRFTRCWGIKTAVAPPHNQFEFGCRAEQAIDISDSLAQYMNWQQMGAGVNLENLLALVPPASSAPMNDVLKRLVHVFAGPMP